MSKAKTVSIEPLGDRVAIRPATEVEERSPGGIYIPENAREKPVRGEVIAVGPGRTERGVLVPMSLRVGDVVVYGKYSGTEVEVDRESLILIKESDVIAKVTAP